MNNKFFDEENVEKVREKQKEEAAINKQKAEFAKINFNNSNLEGSNGYNYQNEQLLRNYIGPNFDNMMKRNFSIWAIIFGPLYYLYWKMYLQGGFFLLFENFIIAFLQKYIGVFVYLIILLLRLIYGATFKDSYINHAINKVMIIKKKYVTKNTSEICAKQGGPSIIMAIISILAIEFVFFLLRNFLIKGI